MNVKVNFRIGMTGGTMHGAAAQPNLVCAGRALTSVERRDGYLRNWKTVSISRAARGQPSALLRSVAFLLAVLSAACGGRHARGDDASQRASLQVPLICLVGGYYEYAGHGARCTPTFQVYQSGLVIYATNWNCPDDAGKGFMAVNLDKDELGALLEELRIKEFRRLKSHYEATDAWDAPSLSFQVFTPTLKFKLIRVYGLSQDMSFPPGQGPELRLEELAPDSEQHRAAKARKRLPPLLLDAFDKMMAFRHPRARSWTPPWIEVMLIRAGPDGPAADWPEDWPELSTARVEADEHHGEIRGYYLVLPRSALAKARRLRGNTVTVGDKPYQIDYCFLFPNQWPSRRSRVK